MALPLDLIERMQSASPKEEGARWAETVPRYREAVERKLRGLDVPVRRKIVDGLLWHIPYADRGLGRLIARSRRLPTMFEIEQARRLGAHGHTMVDIGANVGMTSIPRVSLGYFTRAVVAEPAQADFRCLVQNVVVNRLRGRVLPDNCAIYSHTGVVRFREQEQSGVHRVSGKEKDGEVPSFTLDDWLDQRGIRPRHVHFVKSDAQGSEGHVFAGAEELLRLRRAIWQIEYWRGGSTRSIRQRPSCRISCASGSRTSCCWAAGETGTKTRSRAR